MPPTIGPTRHRQPRPGPGGDLAEARREEEHQDRDRRRRQTRLERRVAGDLLEEEADEEEAADQARVGRERGQVGDRRSCGSGRGRAAASGGGRGLADDEEAEADDPGDHRQPDHRARPSRWPAARSGRRSGRRARSPRAGSRGSRSRGRRPRRGSPRPPAGSAPRCAAISGMLTQKIARQEIEPDQGAAAGRPEHGRDPGPGGPGADRLAARLAGEGRGDDRQRAGDEQRAGDPLQGAGADQELVGRRDRAERSRWRRRRPGR